MSIFTVMPARLAITCGFDWFVASRIQLPACSAMIRARADVTPHYQIPVQERVWQVITAQGAGISCCAGRAAKRHAGAVRAAGGASPAEHWILL